MEGGVTIQVAADLYGRKENILIEFQAGSTLAEVVRQIEFMYDEEAKARRPLSVPYKPFEMQYMQLYSADEGWLDVLSVRQLTEGCQVFAFQPKSSDHSDSQELIPVAKQSTMKCRARSRSTSPRRGVQQPDWLVDNIRRVPPTIEEISAVYQGFNASTPGHVTISEIRLSLQRLGVELSLTTVASLFGYPPASHSDIDTRSVTLDDWLRFSAEHPNIISALCRQGTPPELMREVVDGQKKRLEILQKTHKDAVARAQQHASERLYRGKSSSGMGGKRSMAAEHNRSSSKAATPVQRRSSSSTSRWRPTGKRVENSTARSASTTATPVKRKASNPQSKQRSSSMSANYSAVPRGGISRTQTPTSRQVSPIRATRASPSVGGVSFQPSQSPMMSAEQQLEAYETYKNQLILQQRQLLAQAQQERAASPSLQQTESYAEIEARLMQSMPGGSRAASPQPQSPPRQSPSLVSQSVLQTSAQSVGGVTGPVSSAYNQPQPYVRSEPLPQLPPPQQLAVPAELPPPAVPVASQPPPQSYQIPVQSVSQSGVAQILSPGGSHIPLPVAPPPMVPGETRMTPLPPPTPAYASEIRSPSASVSSVYPARSLTASSSIPPSKRWYPNLVSPAPGA